MNTNPMEIQYRRWVHHAIAIAVLVQASLGALILAVEQGHRSSLFVWLIHASLAMVGGCVILVYEHVLWRFFCREFDYGGTWIFENRYGPTDASDSHPIIESGELNIEQSPLGLRIVEAVGGVNDAGEEKWWTTSAHLNCEMSTIFTSFRCHRSLSYPIVEERGVDYVGCEEITVEKRANGKSGRPIRMKGRFYAFNDRDKSVNWGETVYTRK